MATSLAGAAVAAACGGPSASTQKPALTDAPVTIQLYKRATISEADLATMLQEWRALHPTWKVDVVQNKNNLEMLAPHLAGGDKIKYHPLGDGNEMYRILEPVLADIHADKATVRAAIPPLQGHLQAIVDRSPPF